MLNRNVSLVVCLGVLAGATLAQTPAGTSYVIEFGAANTTGQFQGYPSAGSTFGTPAFSNTGPSGSTQLIPKPDGTKYYVVGTNAVDDFTSNFGTPSSVNGLQGTLNPPNTTVQSCTNCPSAQAVISPDGRYLLVPSSVGSGAGAVYVLNTATDAVAMTQAISGAVVGIVVSRDSKTAWILGESSQTFITTINLTTLQQAGPPIILKDPVTNNSLGGGATGMTMSPIGLLYVSAADAIIEINPATLSSTQPSFTQIAVNATAGPLNFLNDGTMAYFVNETPYQVGQSLLSISIPAHTVKSWPPFQAGQQLQVFDQIIIASPTRIFAHSPGNTTLWDVAPDFSAVNVSTLNSILPASSVLSIAASNEVPSAQYFYALVGSGNQATIYRVVLSTNTVDSQASAQGTGTIQFAIVPPQSNPTGITQFNATQNNLAAGATAATLLARIYDPTGRPMYNVPVTFTGDPSLIFTNVTAVSNEDGYVQATVTLGTSTEPAGSYPVTLTAGSGTNIITAIFQLTIPGAGVGPINPNGPNLMTITAGNGQLCQSGFQCPVELTIQELDAMGNPIVNDDITFTVTGANASIGFVPYGGTTQTDTTGTAETQFFSQPIPYNVGFEGTTVTAVGTQGAVTFNVTVYQLDPNNPGTPSAYISVPQSIQPIVAGEGDVVPNVIVATIFNHAFVTAQPLVASPRIGGSTIPNIAINITSPDATGNPGPGSCQNNPLTADTGGGQGDGTVSCNFVASCSAGLGLHGFTVDFGNAIDSNLGYSVNIVPGSTTALAITGGNNQSGRPGSALTLPLAAQVTDKCGTPSQGVTVTWKVTQGTATLATTSTVSNQGGNVATHLTLGQIPGTIQVTASIGTTTLVTFTETVSAVVGTLKLVSGGGQSALINQAFAAPLVFQISDTANNAVQNLTVTFALTGGTATLGATTATTNAQGQVSLNVTAGGIPGTVSITATYSTFTASASLTVTTQGPQLTPSSFTSWATSPYQVGITPCGLAILTGPGLANGITGVINGTNLGIGPWPYTLSGVSITINGTPVPIAAVSNQNGVQQVYFQTPCEIVAGSPATVVVQVGSASTQITGVTVYPAQPGIFNYAGPGGAAYAEVIDNNGNYLTPSNLASAGHTYYLIVTGLGQTTPAATTNAVGTGSQTISPANIILAINNVGVPVTSVQYQQGERGIYLIAFTIPVPFATGTNLPISLGVTVNSQTFFENTPVSIVLPGIH